LGVSPTKPRRNGGRDIRIGFREPRSGGGSNAKIASVLEHGRVGQEPRPFMRKSRSQSRKAAENAMAERFADEVAKL